MTPGTGTQPAGSDPREPEITREPGVRGAELPLKAIEALAAALTELGGIGARLSADPASLASEPDLAERLTRLATAQVAGYQTLNIAVPKEIADIAFGKNPFMLPEVAPGLLPVALEQAWFNGKIMPERAVLTGLQNHTLHYAGSAFGGIRINNGFVFRADDHVDRFRESIETLGLKLSHTDEELIKAITDLAQENGVRDTYVRIVGFRGEASLGVKSAAPVEVAILMMPWKAYYSDLPLRVAETMKVPHECYAGGDMTRAKWAANYAFSRAALDHELKKGPDGKSVEADLVFLDRNGNVAECSGSNVFCVQKDGTILTPKRDGILAGWTRDTAITLLRDAGHTVIETDFGPDTLLKSEGVFLSGTAAGIVPVKKIAPQGADNYVEIGGGRMPKVITDLQDLYGRVVRGEEPKYRNWLTAI